MQTWLMLCFGESVIGLLLSPINYDRTSFEVLMVSFGMVFCLVTVCKSFSRIFHRSLLTDSSFVWSVVFDVTDADRFLHLLLIRGEKGLAFS